MQKVTEPDGVVQSTWQCSDERFQVGNLQCLPELCVVVLFEWIKVESEGSPKQNGVLWYDSQSRSELVKSQLRDIHSVDGDVALKTGGDV